ncbi:MAG: hypothetical protein ACRC45_00575 [Cetobacterium sp.]
MKAKMYYKNDIITSNSKFKRETFPTIEMPIQKLFECFKFTYGLMESFLKLKTVKSTTITGVSSIAFIAENFTVSNYEIGKKLNMSEGSVSRIKEDIVKSKNILNSLEVM